MKGVAEGVTMVVSSGLSGDIDVSRSLWEAMDGSRNA